MKSVSATQAKQGFARVLDAAQRAPVRIRRRNRDVAVVISSREYARLRGVSIDDLRSFCDRVGRRAAARGLTTGGLARLLARPRGNARTPAR